MIILKLVKSDDLLNFLFEDKLSDAIVANPEIADLLKKFEGINPKFIPILIKFLNGWEFSPEELEQLQNSFKFFDNASKRGILQGSEKDISSYMSWDPFTFIEKMTVAYRQKTEREAEKEAKANSKLIYKDSTYVVLEPLQSDAACYYGYGTKWCISSKQSSYFDSYTRQGIRFIFVINRITNEKHAVVGYPGKKEIEVFNAEDDKENPSVFFGTLINKDPKVADAILSYLGEKIGSTYKFSQDISIIKKYVDVLETHEPRDGISLTDIINVIDVNIDTYEVLDFLTNFIKASPKGSGRSWLYRHLFSETKEIINKSIVNGEWVHTYPLLKLHATISKYIQGQLVDTLPAIRQFIMTAPGISNLNSLVFIDGFQSNVRRYEELLNLHYEYKTKKDPNVLNQLNQLTLIFLNSLTNNPPFAGYNTSEISAEMEDLVKSYWRRSPDANYFSIYVLPWFNNTYNFVKGAVGYSDILDKIIENAPPV